MQNAANPQRLSFNRLNSALLKSSSKPGFCQYVWVENSVALKNPAFDETMFRKCKIARMIDVNTLLSIAELQQILDQVISANAQLVLDISYATKDNWQSCDARFNEILDCAVAEAAAASELISEHHLYHNASFADNAKAAKQHLDSKGLSKGRKLEFPAQVKFTNQSRH
jgi:hypothetical protein